MKHDRLSLVEQIEHLPSKRLYLVHEPGDLVTLAQSLMLSRALVDNGILFKQQVSATTLLLQREMKNIFSENISRLIDPTVK